MIIPAWSLIAMLPEEGLEATLDIEKLSKHKYSQDREFPKDTNDISKEL